MRLLLIAMFAAASSACHGGSPPPSTPAPTDPSNVAREHVAEVVLDASITQDAAPRLDASLSRFDGGPLLHGVY